MKKVTTYFLTFIYISVMFSQSPSIEWQKSLGGTNHDYGNGVTFTNDGGCIIAGESYSTNGDVTGNHGEGDFWVVKLDMEGEIEWQNCLGGSSWDRAKSVICATDGGFIVAGTTRSDDGDISFLHGQDDVWLVKLDLNGNIEWEKTYGNFDGEGADCIQQTTDGGYVIAGTGGSCNNHQGLIIKIDCNGVIQWEKEVGGYGTERIYSIKQDPNNRYVFAGYSQSGGHGSYDYYVGVLDSMGILQWYNLYGGNVSDIAYSVDISHEGGYIIAGKAESNNGNVSGNHGDSDYWILNLDTVGNIVWQKTFGGSSGDIAHSIKRTEDYCYIIAGTSFSNDGDVAENHGGADFWIIKIDQSGDLIWQKTYGGTDGDIARSIYQINSLGYIVAGSSFSNDGDVSGHHGSDDYSDYWVVKISHETGIGKINNNTFEKVSMFPNPTQKNLQIVTDENYIFKLFNINGELINNGYINKRGLIELSDYKNGIYILYIINTKGDIIASKKIIRN